MSDLARLRIWSYRRSAMACVRIWPWRENRRPATFASPNPPNPAHLATSGEEALWAELDRLTPLSPARWQAIRAGAPLPATADGPSLLDLPRACLSDARPL